MTSGLSEDGHPRGPSGLPVGDLLRTGPVTVDVATPSRALAVGAHPDDIEFGCATTLAKWAAHGCQVHYLVLTDGSKGSWDPDADLNELVTARQSECRAAACVLDGREIGSEPPDDRIFFLGRTDGELENGADERRAVARVIRQVRPAVLLGHDPWRRYRLHPDHRAAGEITIGALVAARDPHFFPELELTPHRPDALLLWEADQPNHVERADGYESTKVDALLCHHSQFESTMGMGPDLAQRSSSGARREFEAKVRHQLADHGSLAGPWSGEAFHLMDDI